MPKKSNKFIAGVYLCLVVIAVILLAGTLFYRYYEGLTWVNALYFTSMTVVTVGFGDFVPTKPASRIFTTIFALVSIPSILFCLGYVIEGLLKTRIDEVEDRMDELAKEEREIIAKEKLILANEEKILARVEKDSK